MFGSQARQLPDDGGFLIVIESTVKCWYGRDSFENTFVRSAAQDVFDLGVVEGAVCKQAYVHSQKVDSLGQYPRTVGICDHRASSRPKSRGERAGLRTDSEELKGYRAFVISSGVAVAFYPALGDSIFLLNTLDAAIALGRTRDSEIVPTPFRPIAVSNCLSEKLWTLPGLLGDPWEVACFRKPMENSNLTVPESYRLGRGQT
jgi:hypothetical protein